MICDIKKAFLTQSEFASNIHCKNLKAAYV